MLLTQRYSKPLPLRYQADEEVMRAADQWLEGVEVRAYAGETLGRVQIPLEIEEFRLRVFRR